MLAGVTATASLFSLTRDNILVTDPIDTAFLIQAGKERRRGGEIDVTWELGRAFVVRGGYAYLDAEIVENTDPTQIGKKRPNAPQNQFNFCGAYTVQSGLLRNLRVGVGVVYSGKTFAHIALPICRSQYQRLVLRKDFSSYPISRPHLD